MSSTDFFTRKSLILLLFWFRTSESTIPRLLVWMWQGNPEVKPKGPAAAHAASLFDISHIPRPLSPLKRQIGWEGVGLESLSGNNPTTLPRVL